MALPTKDNISTLQFSLDGSPWCRVAAKSGIELDSLAFSVDGSPWWGIEATSVSASWKMYVGAVQITTIYVGSTQASTAYVGSNVLIT